MCDSQPRCARSQPYPLASRQHTWSVNDWPSMNSDLHAIHVQIARELGFTLQSLPPTLTPEQTAVVLDVSIGTLEQWRAGGKKRLTFQKTGRAVRYPVWEIADFILRHTYQRQTVATEQGDVCNT